MPSAVIQIPVVGLNILYSYNDVHTRDYANDEFVFFLLGSNRASNILNWGSSTRALVNPALR